MNSNTYIFNPTKSRLGAKHVVTALCLLGLSTACSDKDTNDGGNGGSGDVSNGGSGGTQNQGGGGSHTGGTSNAGNGGTAGSHEGGSAGTSDLDAGDQDAGTSPVDSNATPLVLQITPGGHDRFYNVTFDADDNIYAVGVTSPDTTATTDFATVLAKFKPSGELDTSFGVGGYAIRNVAVGTNGELARGLVVQSTGKIVISATVEHVGGDALDRDIALLRYNADGTKDTTFGTDGVVLLDLSTGVAVSATQELADSAWGLAVYPDDRLVLSGGLVSNRGTDTDFALVRLSADGVPDESFGTHGIFTLDTEFNGASNNASPRNLTLLPSTQGIIGAGYQPIPPADTRAVVYHVSDTGVLDTTFATAGVFSESILAEQTETYAAVPQSDGKLCTTGYGRDLEADTTDIISLRLNTDGTRDLSYGDNGLVRIDVGGFGDNSRKLVVLPNDYIVLVGGGRPVTDNVDGFVGVLTPDGKLDKAFNASGWKTYDLGGPADFLWGVALSPSKTHIAVAGIKGVGTTATTGDDDAVLMVLNVNP